MRESGKGSPAEMAQVKESGGGAQMGNITERSQEKQVPPVSPKDTVL